MKRLLQVAALGLSLVAAGQVSANELDPKPAVRPNALVVREDANGNREVFTTNISSVVASDDAAAAALTQVERQVSVQSSELDRGTSTEAWYYYRPSYNYYYGYNYNWGYNPYYYGYRYNYSYYYYYPTYHYNYGGYRYSYYWCY